jgi:hypothetical protein
MIMVWRWLRIHGKLVDSDGKVVACFTRSFCFLHQFVEAVTCESAVIVDSLRKCVVF